MIKHQVKSDCDTVAAAVKDAVAVIVEGVNGREQVLNQRYQAEKEREKQCSSILSFETGKKEEDGLISSCNDATTEQYVDVELWKGNLIRCLIQRVKRMRGVSP